MSKLHQPQRQMERQSPSFHIRGPWWTRYVLVEESETLHFSLPHVHVHTLFFLKRLPVSSQILTGIIRVRICYGWMTSKSCQLWYTAVSLSHFVSQWHVLLKLAMVSSIPAGRGLAVKISMASGEKTHMSWAVTLPQTQISLCITFITFICIFHEAHTLKQLHIFFKYCPTKKEHLDVFVNVYYRSKFFFLFKRISLAHQGCIYQKLN